MKNKLIVTIVAIVGVVVGITTADASSAPNMIFRSKYFEKNDDGLYKICDGKNLIYIYHEYGGLSGSSLEVQMNTIANGC